MVLPRRTWLVAAAMALMLTPGLGALPLPDPLDLAPSVVGAWTQPADSGAQATHAALLPTGKILLYSSNDAVRLLDPATGALQDMRLPWGENLFCSGHTVLPDGRVLVIGGTKPGYFFMGEEETFLFDPWTETWSRGPVMSTGRWYPSPVTLGDGRVVVFSGLNGVDGAVTPLVEELAPPYTAWRVIPGANLGQSLFPRMILLPTGELVRAGHEGSTLFFDPDAGTWRPGPFIGEHWQGSAVLLPGLDKVLVSGGFGATAPAVPGSQSRADILDLTGPAPEWRVVDSMTLARRDHNLVLLADGQVLAVGGAGGTFPLRGVPVNVAAVQNLHGQLNAMAFRWPSQLHAERFDPETESWQVMAPALRGRTYHSTALLLPDGRVWVGGGDIELNPAQYETTRTYEVFSPPYLFQGARPTIAAAPGGVTYGGAFQVATPDAGAVDRVALVRLGSATHAFNFDQRYVDLPFTAGTDALEVAGPPTADHAPPGWYMLFLVNGDGVPSEAKMVRVA